MRWNERKNTDMFALVVIRLLIASALQYKTLIANPGMQVGEASEPDEPF